MCMMWFRQEIRRAKYRERLLDLECNEGRYVETSCSGSSLESKMMNLVILVMEDRDPEQSILCNQVRLPVVELGNQPSHKTLMYNLSPIQISLENGGTTLWE